MATSPDILIADEITAAIRGRSFVQKFQAERLYAADWDIKDELDCLQVGVWPGESAGEIWERTTMLKSYKIGLTFAKRIAAVSREELDRLMDCVNEVVEFLELQTVQVPDGRTYYFTAWEYVVRFVEEVLNRNKGADGCVKYTGDFVSILAFDYQSTE